MSVDLKGNTNYVAFKDLNHELIAVRTNLSAVDMTVGNGLKVDGDMLYATLATDEDIENGTRGHLIDAEGIKPFLTDLQVVAGDGTIVTGSTVDTKRATVEETLTGAAVAEDKTVSVEALKGALTTGQAVDVTSAPDGVTDDYLGSFTVTGSSLGFAAFPKYAKNLNYLFIATIVPTTAGTVTPSANCKWLDTGDRAAKSVAAGVSVKLAVTFTSSADTCPASFVLSGTGSVAVSYCRQYEVTACTAESIAYIASLSNPDAFADYYLVKADMVQPWTYIIDMGTSPAVTVAAGLSYKLNASTGTHTLTVDTCPAGYDGRDAIIRITLGGNAVVQAVAPLQLGGALVPYAINNCVVRFRDGEAVLLVEDTLAGYVVTVTSGIDNGSLAYGLAATGVPYIAFSTGTDGSVVDMGDAVTANEEVTVVGNGYTNTTVTGNITCTNKTTVANLSLQDVTVTGGTLTLGDVNISSGSTVAVSGGGLAIDKVEGNGGVIDFAGTTIPYSYTPNGMFIGGVTLMGASRGLGGLLQLTAKTATFSDCVITSNVGTKGVLYAEGSTGYLKLSDTIITGNSSTNGYATLIVTDGATCELTSCYFHDNYVHIDNDDAWVSGGGATLILSGSTITQGLRVTSGGSASFRGTNVLTDTLDGPGVAMFSSGAILDLTGNTNTSVIGPGGKIVIEDATFLYGPTAGTVASSATITGATFTSVLGNNANIIATTNSTPLAGDAIYSGITFQAGSSWRPIGYSIRLVNCSTDGQFWKSEANGKFSTITLSGTFTASTGDYIINGSLANAGVLILENNTTITVTSTASYFTGSMGTLTIGTGCTINGRALPAGTFTSCTLRTIGAILLDGTGTISTAAKLDATITGTTGSLVFSSGASLDLTDNSNQYPVAPGGTMTFATGGATVTYTSGTGSKSYMMDNVTLPSGAKLTNTAMVDLGGTSEAACYGSVSGISISSGRLTLSGGTANNTTLNFSGYLYVNPGGTANNTTLNRGGLRVSAGGTANSATVNSGSYIDVFSRGVVNNATVNDRGILFASGTANEPVINSGGSLNVTSIGSALLVTSNTGAIVTVAAGGYITYKE